VERQRIAIGEIEFDDMNAFRQAGGKLAMWHGWADGLLPPQLTMDFYEALAKKSGGMAAAQDFARLLMVPGMDHCGLQTNGPGIADTGIDPLTALEQWVEQGQAPTELIAPRRRQPIIGRCGGVRCAPIQRLRGTRAAAIRRIPQASLAPNRDVGATP
jgi:Tannase and feruloyl esterase